MLINVFRIIKQLQVDEFEQVLSWTLQEPDLRITGLPYTVRVWNKKPILIVPYFESLIENINIYY